MKYYWMLLYLIDSLINCAEEEGDYGKIVGVAEEMVKELSFNPVDFESEAYGLLLEYDIPWKKVVEEMIMREGELKKMGERYRKLLGDVKSEDKYIIESNNLFGDSCMV